MLCRESGGRWGIGGWTCLAFLACASSASALESAADRHPPLRSPATKPAGVPSNYVLTHNGFFDPSCVVSLRSDEIMGADLVARGMDGTEHVRFSPCAYPRYSLSGVPIVSASPSGNTPAHQPHAATYDGWIVFYGYDGRIAVGSILTTQWVVPLPPANVGDQDIAFFNDIETTAGGEDILQPVLDFSEIPGHWAIESEHCCIGGNDEQSMLVQVSPGDTVLGTVTPTNCDATGACASWTVTTTDVTTGKSTVLNTTAPMGIPNSVNPGVLEAYGVASCDMFPASGETTFIDSTLTNPDGGSVETLKYDLGELASPPAGFVACGYGGSTSGNTYTLIYSPTPMTDAGAPVDAGSIDATVGGLDAGPHDASMDASSSVDATMDASSSVDAGGSNDASDAGSLDSSVMTFPDAASEAQAAEASVVVDAAAVDGGIEVIPPPDSGGSDATIAASLSDGGGVEAGVIAIDGSFLADSSVTSTPDSSQSGCGCTFAGANGGFSLAPLSLLLLVGVRRRRTRAVGGEA